MIFGKTKLELKVGIFVFASLAILSVFILSIGGIKTWTSSYRANFIFNFVNGAKVGAPVRYAGVDVGDIRRIKIYFSPEENRSKVKLICMIKKDARIPADSVIIINTLGLLGEKYLEILPGKDYKNCLIGGQSMNGIDPISMTEVTDLAKSIANNINEIVIAINQQKGTIGKLLYDPALYDEFEGFATDIHKNPWKLIWKTKEKK